MKIAFIGGGTMGSAILAAVLDKKLLSTGDITVMDIVEDRLDFLKKEYGVGVTGDYSEAVDGKDVVVLATKPYNTPEVTRDLNGKLKSDQLVLSIMAGIKIDTLKQGLGHIAIVRVMPNTPAQVGEGMSVWVSTPETNRQQKEMAGAILGAIGKEIYVDDEKYMDMVTAVSGSGPAYFFIFVEALEEAAIQIGLPAEVAHELAIQTMIGSGKLIRESGIQPAELRRMVTTPGGTTAAALEVFENGDFRGLIKKAIRAAYDRGIEMGRENK